MKKTLKVIRVVAVVVVSLLLFVVLLVSLFGGSVAKSYVNSHGEALIGRQVRVEHVGVNLFSGRIGVHGLDVFEENGTDKFAGFDTLDVAVSLLRLIDRTIYLRHLSLVGLDVNVVQDGDKLNFYSIIDHFASDSVAKLESDTVQSGWKFSLHGIRLSDGSVSYTDLRRNTSSGFSNLDLSVPDFVVGGEDKVVAGLAVQFVHGGMLRTDATWNDVSQDFVVDLILEDLALDQMRGFNEILEKLQEIKGTLGVEVHVSGNLKRLMEMQVSGKANVNGLDLVDGSLGSLASLERMEVDLNKVVLSEKVFDVNSVVAEGLNVRYELYVDSSNTFSRLLASAEEVSADTAAVTVVASSDSMPASASMRFCLKRLDISRMNVIYADHTMPDDFAFPITNIRITADSITTAGNNSAKVFANLPGGGALLVKWSGNISDWKRYQDLRLDVKGLHLSTLSPFMVSYFGVPITDGVFSFSSHNAIYESRLDGKNVVDMYRPAFGDRRKEVKPRLKLPVKAALFVLKDKDDKVLLDVPITGNIDNPEFDYMKLVWKTLGNLVVKVASSPMRIFGSKEDSADAVFIAVDPIDPGFTSEQFYQIDQVADVVKSGAGYRMAIRFECPPTEDSVVIKNREIRSRILQKHMEDLGILDDGYTISSPNSGDDVKAEGFWLTLELKEDFELEKGEE